MPNRPGWAEGETGVGATVAAEHYNDIARALYRSAEGATAVVAAEGGDYSKLSTALSAITGGAGNKKLIVVRGKVVETAAVVAKDFIDVLFLPGAELRIEKAAGGAALTFSNITDSVWSCPIKGGARIIHEYLGTASTNVAISVSNSGSGYVMFRNLVIENHTPNAVRGYGIDNGQRMVVEGCHIKTRSPDRPYGVWLRGVSDWYDSFIEVDPTFTGNASMTALLAQGWSGRMERCVAHGGRSTGSVDGAAYGAQIFASSVSLELTVVDSIFVGGAVYNAAPATAAVAESGLYLPGAGGGRFVNCMGIAGRSGHGIALGGGATSTGAHELTGCVGIAHGTSAQHGLSMEGAWRGTASNCSFYGPNASATGYGMNASSVALGTLDTRHGRFLGCNFFGGYAGWTPHSDAGAAQANQYAAYLTGTGRYEFVECRFMSNALSPAVFVGDNAKAYLRFYGGYAGSLAPGTYPAIKLDPGGSGTWTSAPIHNMVLAGGAPGVTPAAGTALGTNVVP